MKKLLITSRADNATDISDFLDMIDYVWELEKRVKKLEVLTQSER